MPIRILSPRYAFSPWDDQVGQPKGQNRHVGHDQHRNDQGDDKRPHLLRKLDNRDLVQTAHHIHDRPYRRGNRTDHDVEDEEDPEVNQINPCMLQEREQYWH